MHPASKGRNVTTLPAALLSLAVWPLVGYAMTMQAMALRASSNTSPRLASHVCSTFRRAVQERIVPNWELYTTQDASARARRVNDIERHAGGESCALECRDWLLDVALGIHDPLDHMLQHEPSVAGR